MEIMFLLLFLLFSQNTGAFETQIWKGGTYFYDVYALNRTAAWNGTFDLKVVFNPGNLSYPNILTVSNYFHSTFNNYNISPAVDLRDEQSNFKASIPENTNESVSPMPNAFLKIFFDSQMLYEYDAPWFLDGLIYINDGVIFLSNGSIPPSNNRCYTKIIEGRVHGLNGTLRFCFNDLENTVIENDNEGKCREFETIAAISSIVNGNISQSIIFTVQYILLEDKINVTLDVRSSSPPDFKKLIINGEHDSYGWCDDDGSSFSSCKLELNVPEFDDFQYEFIFACTGWEDITVGELIKRNGVFVRDINIPFTSANPCWTKKGEIHIFDTNLYNASFCCKTFDNDIPITTPTATSSSIFSTKLMTLTTGTTSLPSTNSPNTNSYGTLCSTNTSQAWLDIIFIVDIAFSMSTKNLQQMSGEIATVLQSFTFNQNGEHTTRAGIIIYGSEFATLYELNNVTNFVGFEKVFLSLFKYYDPYDYDSNVYSALDAAYRLLQIQNSHRIPLIVLISATYNPSGFKGTSELSRNIKGNGTNIVVINFDPENPNLTNALQAIVSSGYYYVSTQQDLYINLGYAFTQLNCICPSDSKQFRLFNPAWNNYTNFADCLSGVPGDTSPSIANLLCNENSGVLVSISNPQVFDFIIDNLIPYDLKGVKKFSIGLHKSDADGLWKWWNYDGSETMMGYYPNMSTNPPPTDNYGYMWNYNGFNWKLLTGKDVPLPYICQYKSCDVENFCDIKSSNP